MTGIPNRIPHRIGHLWTNREVLVDTPSDTPRTRGRADSVSNSISYPYLPAWVNRSINFQWLEGLS